MLGDKLDIGLDISTQLLDIIIHHIHISICHNMSHHILKLKYISIHV